MTEPVEVKIEFGTTKKKEYICFVGPKTVNIRIKDKHVLISREDLERLVPYRIHLYESASGLLYCRVSTKPRPVLLGTFLYGDSAEYVDGDPLNCTRSNLALHESNHRKRPQKNSSTGVVGVHPGYKEGTYKVYINYNGKQKYLGQYSALWIAKKVRLNAEEKYLGRRISSSV